MIPTLVDSLRFSDAVILACKQKDVVLFLWEGEQEQSIRQVLSDLDFHNRDISVGLFIGPEGGFSENEVKQAVKAGCVLVTLGKRILRMETAAVTAAALVLYQAGDLG